MGQLVAIASATATEKDKWLLELSKTANIGKLRSDRIQRDILVEASYESSFGLQGTVEADAQGCSRDTGPRLAGPAGRTQAADSVEQESLRRTETLLLLDTEELRSAARDFTASLPEATLHHRVERPEAGRQLSEPAHPRPGRPNSAGSEGPEFLP
jgi:hypothetical protein